MDSGVGKGTSNRNECIANGLKTDKISSGMSSDSWSELRTNGFVEGQDSP